MRRSLHGGNAGSRLRHFASCIFSGEPLRAAAAVIRGADDDSPLGVNTTPKPVCEIAIGESLQDGDWETAASTTGFYHLLRKDWHNVGLSIKPATTTEEKNLKNKLLQSRGEKKYQGHDFEDFHRRPELTEAHKKVQHYQWLSAEKEAVWRQVGIHILVRTVPGKEVCQ